MITKTSHLRPAPGFVAKRDPTAPVTRSFYARFFFVGMAVVFIAINALGFVPQLLFIHAQKIPLHWFTHVHGAIMTGWLLLFLAQALLAATGRFKYHRLLGVFSAGWGAMVWATSLIVVVGALVRDNPPEESGQFATLALSLGSIAVFGSFFTWGLRARKDAAVHKRLVFLAMLPLMSAGIDRIQFLPGLQNAYFARFIYLDLLLVPLVAYDLVTLRRIHRITVIGAACLIGTQVIVTLAAASPAWHRFVYRSLTPFVERLPEISLSDAQSDPLLGDYGGSDWKMTVSRDGGALYLQLPNLPKWKLGAYSTTELFLKTDKWTLTFTMDEEGRVTKVVNTQPGTTWEVARVK